MKARIIGCGKVKLKLQVGRIRTLSGVFHIPALAKNLISVSKLDDVGVKIVFEKDTCKMVQGALVGLKGYKLWNPVTRKVVYSRDVVFREVKNVIKCEVPSKEPEKIEFELKEEESESIAEEESGDEEPQTPVVRRSVRERRRPKRYSPYDLCSNFALSITDDDPRTVKEAVHSTDGKLWKEAMVDEITFLHKNESWDMVELLEGNTLAANGCSRRRQMQKERWRNTKLGW
eukprot:PITA_03660